MLENGYQGARHPENFSHEDSSGNDFLQGVRA